MHNISIFGTASDAGKSTLTFVIARALQRRGISTVPFKAQNVSNNAVVADDNSEIGVSTSFQAEVLGVKTSWHLNPVLLKSGSRGRSAIVLRGKEVEQKDIHAYYRDLDMLKPAVMQGFQALDAQYDCVVAEGAGGCVELNLLDKDLSNTFVAEKFNTKIVLVADIEKGGVFAQVYGTVALLKEQFRKNLIGVVINKFRGDRTLFDEGVKIIEEDFGVPVLGVLPYMPLNLGFEDSANLCGYTQKPGAKIRVGVIRFPHISNFTDFEPLILDDEVEVHFVTSGVGQYDLLCLPGSKRVGEDLLWLRESGLAEELLRYEGKIVAICGGYEMLFEELLDYSSVELPEFLMKGLGMVPDRVMFGNAKFLRRHSLMFEGMRLEGYEMRYGTACELEEQGFYADENLFGTFLHGLFENDAFRSHVFCTIDPDYRGYDFKARRAARIEAFVEAMEAELDMERIVSCIGA